jgi:hypothetical protein
MERYFDAFLYLANWGTRQLMFRLPREVLDAETVGLYCYTDAASLLETKDHLIVSLYADRDPDDYWEEAAGRLAAMVQARSDLAAGELRLLYLGWLLAVQSDDVDDADTEPPVPAGLGELSAPLRAVADFLDIDQDLLAAAAEASPDAREEDHGGLPEWIASLKAKEKDALLARVVAGEGAAVQALLSRRFRRACGGNEPAAATRNCGRRPVTARRHAKRPRRSTGASRRPTKPRSRRPRTPGALTNSPPGRKRHGNGPAR